MNMNFLEKMILEDQIRYSEVIELFTDKVYRDIDTKPFMIETLLQR